MREKYISILQNAAKENGGRSVLKSTRSEIFSITSNHCNYFGSWTKALQAAGLKTNTNLSNI